LQGDIVSDPNISGDALSYLIDRRLVYTHGGGPGIIDVISMPAWGVDKSHLPTVKDPEKPETAEPIQPEKPESIGCATGLTLLLLIPAAWVSLKFLAYVLETARSFYRIILNTPTLWSASTWIVISAIAIVIATFRWLALSLRNERTDQ
jgi:hypothetical protein